MASKICLVFEVHQPERLNSEFAVPSSSSEQYFNPSLDKQIFGEVTKNCYNPLFDRFISLGGKPGFAVNLSISSSWIAQAQQYAPYLIRKINRVPDRSLDIIGQAYKHSLSAMFSSHSELRSQINKHKSVIESEFDISPVVGTNTELIYSTRVSDTFSEAGYKAVFAEGGDAFRPAQTCLLTGSTGNMVITRNRDLTDDVAYRFSDSAWGQQPLTPEKYVSWIEGAEEEVVVLFMDIETIGEHHWRDTGIFDFFDSFVDRCLDSGIEFVKARDVASRAPKGNYCLPEDQYSSWADESMDESAWTGNCFQRRILQRLERLETRVLDQGSSEDAEVWRKLLTSDHFHHMSLKGSKDGNVHDYFSYFDSPYDCYGAFSHIVDDFESSLQ